VLLNNLSLFEEPNKKDDAEYKHPQKNEGHDEWIQEISEAVDADGKLKNNLKYLSNSLGPLSMLIYTRLYTYFQIILTGSTQ